jgi:hypothetical protein
MIMLMYLFKLNKHTHTHTHQGQGDGGVYFSMLGPASFGYGTEEGDQYERNLIADCFGEERMLEYKGKARLDLVLVCAVEEGLLSPAPGGRDNATVTVYVHICTWLHLFVWKILCVF